MTRWLRLTSNQIAYFDEVRGIVNSYTGQDVMLDKRDDNTVYTRYLFTMLLVTGGDDLSVFSNEQIARYLNLLPVSILHYRSTYVPKYDYKLDLKLLRRNLIVHIMTKISPMYTKKLVATQKLNIESVIDAVIEIKQMDRSEIILYAEYLKSYCLNRYT